MSWCFNRSQAENVSEVTDMSGLFQDKADFNHDISDWEVRNVRDMSNMFAGAVKFNQPLYKWKISADCNRKNMFAGATLYHELKAMTPVETLECCMYRKNIPVELWVIIHKYFLD